MGLCMVSCCYCGKAVGTVRNLLLDCPLVRKVVVLFDDWSLLPSFFFISLCFVYSMVVLCSMTYLSVSPMLHTMTCLEDSKYF